MRFAARGLALVTALGLAACANPNRPTDTGNMAYPAPQPAGINRQPTRVNMSSNGLLTRQSRTPRGLCR